MNYENAKSLEEHIQAAEWHRRQGDVAPNKPVADQHYRAAELHEKAADTGSEEDGANARRASGFVSRWAPSQQGE